MYMYWFIGISTALLAVIVAVASSYDKTVTCVVIDLPVIISPTFIFPTRVAADIVIWSLATTAGLTWALALEFCISSIGIVSITLTAKPSDSL